jgi:hypothetical protein
MSAWLMSSDSPGNLTSIDCEGSKDGIEWSARFVLQEEHNLCAKTSCCFRKSMLCHPCIDGNGLQVLESIALWARLSIRMSIRS